MKIRKNKLCCKVDTDLSEKDANLYTDLRELVHERQVNETISSRLRICIRSVKSVNGTRCGAGVPQDEVVAIELHVNADVRQLLLMLLHRRRSAAKSTPTS